MPNSRIRLDHAGIAEVLKSAEVRSQVDALAAEVGRDAEANPSVRRNQVPVVVDHYTTDRAAASVTLKHPAGRGLQAKWGVLTRAAGSAGLEVHE